MKSFKVLKNKKGFILSQSKGMTIVELLVAMTIFVIVITLAIGGFVAISRLSSQAYTMTNVQQNGRTLIEQLTRLSRSAEEIYIPDSGTLQSIAFRNGNDWVCLKATDNPTIVKKYTDKVCTIGGFSLTSPEVKINRMTFVRKEGIPPYLEIWIILESATPALGSSYDTIDLKTTVVLEGT
ncbi:hypothetical protein COY62_03090 [bacterium (Candidatus Howlettbacteria) CG_4_10_14_0_8_um_filter_40_9]|nr:MAG: hypothetical protein COY62_03090 [bacterium (Candidatus Howlettbacteria) CG_4_10_14_0_8_um_filter_40_9]